MHTSGVDHKSRINRKLELKQIKKSQDKGIRIINFKSKNDPSNPLYKSMKILKLNDEILFNNCMFVLKIIRSD